MIGIASALPADDPARRVLLESASRHAEETLVHVASGRYEGEHWLASFAVYALSALAEIDGVDE
jgi:predicted ATP-grasp superfamily ATP-dependent carboligase